MTFPFIYPYIIKYLNLTSTRDVNLKRNGKREFMTPGEWDFLFLLCWDAGIVKHWVLTSDSTRVRVFLVFVLVFRCKEQLLLLFFFRYHLPGVSEIIQCQFYLWVKFFLKGSLVPQDVPNHRTSWVKTHFQSNLLVRIVPVSGALYQSVNIFSR